MAKTKQFRVVLTPGPTDLELENAAYQKELEELGALLEPYKPQIPALLKSMEAIAAPPGDHSGELILLGEYLFAVRGALPSIKDIAGLLLSWKKANNGREVTLEVDGVKAKAQTVEQIEALFKIAKKHTKGRKRGS